MKQNYKNISRKIMLKMQTKCQLVISIIILVPLPKLNILSKRRKTTMLTYKMLHNTRVGRRKARIKGPFYQTTTKIDANVQNVLVKVLLHQHF